MTFVGCDLHTRMQQVAVLDTRTGEVSERQLAHDGSAIEEFYAALPGPVTIGIESTGYAVWFHALMQRLGHTVLVGDAAKIRAMVVRKTKTDRRDALHILDLLRHDRFPSPVAPSSSARPAWRSCTRSRSPRTPRGAAIKASSCSPASPRRASATTSPLATICGFYCSGHHREHRCRPPWLRSALSRNSEVCRTRG